MKTVHPLLLLWLVEIWNSLIVHSRPDDLFLNSTNPPIDSNVGLFSPKGSDDFFENYMNSTNLAFSSEVSFDE